MDENKIKEILQETEAGYDLISGKFSQTRSRFWRGLEFLADYTKNGDKILDFGCGNGRLLELFAKKEVDYLGVDISGELINIAREKHPEITNSFQKISGSDSLAFPDNSFNAVYSIAVFHHLPSAQLRLRIAKELYRILQPRGVVIITVWNLWQKKYIKNIFSNWKNKLLGKSQLDWNDCWISFKDNQGKIFNRYHHAFTRRELDRLFIEAGFKIEKDELVDQRNILLIAKK